MAACGQLRDPLHRCLECVRERELGDRLADDADDGLRAAQGGGDEPDAPAPPERERGSGGKGVEKRELRLVGLAVEIELERRYGRLSERNRRHCPPPFVSALFPSRDERPLPVGDRRFDVLCAVPVVGRIAVEPGTGEERRGRVGLDAPQSSSDRPGGERGEPDNLVGGLGLVCTGDERLSEELERKRPAVSAPLGANDSFQTSRDPDVSCRKAREQPLAFRQRLGRSAVELERRHDPLAHPNRVEARRLGARAGGGASNGRGDQCVRARVRGLELLEAEAFKRQPRAFELGSECGRVGPNGACDEVFAVRREGADDDEIATSRVADRRREAVESSGERPVLEQPSGRSTEVFEQGFLELVCDPPHERIMRFRACKILGVVATGPKSVNIVRHRVPSPA